MEEGISAAYEAWGMSVRLAFGIGGKNWDFRAYAKSEGVVALQEEVTKMTMVGGVGRRWFRSFVHLASCQIPLLPLAASATVCFKCAA